MPTSAHISVLYNIFFDIFVAIQSLILTMGDSDESWSGGDESNSSEDAGSSEPETSDTDEDVKYTTYPTRGVRWRIGEPSLVVPASANCLPGGAGRPQGWEKIKDPKEKRKLWRQGEVI